VAIRERTPEVQRSPLLRELPRLHWKFVIGAPVIVALAGAAYIYAGLGLCGFCDYSPSHRPTGVPPGAVWAGGPDGGSYILCRVDSARDVNPCAVWNDFNGKVVERGDYRLLREKRAATVDELRFTWADRGGWIGLEHNKVLDNVDLKHPR